MSGSGLSGAKLQHDSVAGGVMKTGGDVKRTIAQGEWLLQHKSVSCLPKVKKLLPDGYLMESLVEVEDINLSQVVSMLEYQLWSNDEVRGFMGFWDPQNTESKVLDILMRAETPASVSTAVIDRFETWNRARFGTVHGDMTFENIMGRMSSIDTDYFDSLVFIDPIPPSKAIPSVVGVDVGKLLQSALGWEAAKGETPCPWTVDDVRNVVSEEQFLSGTDWVTVHLARILPYAIASGRTELRKWVFDAIERSVAL